MTTEMRVDEALPALTKTVRPPWALRNTTVFLPFPLRKPLPRIVSVFPMPAFSGETLDTVGYFGVAAELAAGAATTVRARAATIGGSVL